MDFSIVIQSILNSIIETSLLEWIAITTSLAYVVLASKQSSFCWYFALASSVLYILIAISAKLYIDAVLNLFYAVMAILGWWSWRRGIFNEQIAVNSKNLIWHMKWIVLSVFCGVILGVLLAKYTDQAYPFLDSIVFFLSLAATWMITRKILENWLYFVVIDAIMVFIYFNRGYEMSSVLFLLYTGLALYGYFKWKKSAVQLSI